MQKIWDISQLERHENRVKTESVNFNWDYNEDNTQMFWFKKS